MTSVGILFFVLLLPSHMSCATNKTELTMEDLDLNYAVPHYGNIKVFERMECRERKSHGLSWLHHENFYRCINFVSDMAVPSCLYKQLERNGLMYMIKNASMVHDSIHYRRLRRAKCRTFMILTQDLQFIKEVFAPATQLFRPFTNIFLMIPEDMTIPEEFILRTISRGYNVYRVQNHFFDPTFPYFSLNYWHLTNIQTNKTLYTAIVDQDIIAEFFGHMRTHPLFDKSARKARPLRVGLFHCPPNVVVRDAKKKM